MAHPIPKSLASLSDFFSISNARAVVVTDMKLDDALFLWLFFMKNFSRPEEHTVQIDIFVTGIQDIAAGVCLSRHLFESAKAHALKCKDTSLATISMHTFVSSRPAEEAPRHENDTYAPYNNGTPGFPQASEVRSRLKCWQDLTPAECKADLVAVIAQFFTFEVVDSKEMSVRDGILDYLVPKPGGILAFQSGFNTKVPGGLAGGLEQKIWQLLTTKVTEGAAKMVFISNSFSFDKSTWKSGVISPSGSFVTKLKAQAPVPWIHLVEAGLKENLLFATDQMAKYFTKEPMSGVDYVKDGLGDAISKHAEKMGVPNATRPIVSRHLQKQFFEAWQDESITVNPVLENCRELLTLARQSCGEKATDYLCRALANFEKFGATLEATDGQHFACLLQSEVPILFPVEMRQGEHFLEPGFVESADANHIMWGARDIDVPKSLEWLERSVDVAI